MRLKFWQTKRFKSLQNEWYKKLDNDAEKIINGEHVLKQRASNSYRSISRIARENKQRYYELLGSYFHKEDFIDGVEKLVMERKSNGVSIKLISDELRLIGERCHRETIRHIIQKYEKKWDIKRGK